MYGGRNSRGHYGTGDYLSGKHRTVRECDLVVFPVQIDLVVIHRYESVGSDPQAVLVAVIQGVQQKAARGIRAHRGWPASTGRQDLDLGSDDRPAFRILDDAAYSVSFSETEDERFFPGQRHGDRAHFFEQDERFPDLEQTASRFVSPAVMPSPG